MSVVDTFDLIVLGGGSGGLALSQRAARHGARVALLEPGKMGGTCVNVGCVPKKAMWFASESADAQQVALAYGFRSTPGELDWPTFIAAREEYIARNREGYARRLEVAGIEVIHEHGVLEGARRVRAGTRTLQAAHVCIATGARPRRATFAGGELGIDSDGFFALRAAPRHIAIIGGGYIASEISGVLSGLGSRVCLFTRGRELLSRDMDADVAAVLRDRMKQQAIDCVVKSEVTQVRRAEAGYVVLSADGKEHGPYDEVLWAIGRVPNVESLGLASSGVALDARGYIDVDRQQNTNVAGIYAIGDVTANPAFTPYVVRTGRALADRLFGGDADACFAPVAFPAVAYSHPPIAAMGLTEQDAIERYGASQVHVHRTRFVPMRLRLANADRATVMKMICVGDDERIVGLHLCGDAVEEMMQGFAVAVSMGARKRDFNATLAIHPTSAEELVLMA